MDIILNVLIGIVLSVILNVLANWLPTFSPTYRERKAQANANDAPYGPPLRAMQIRYVLVALVTVTAALYLSGWTETRLSFAATLTYVAIFVLIIVIDIEYLIIPDVLIVPAFLYALVEVAITPRIAIQSGLAGYAAAQIIVMIIYIFARLSLAARNRGRPEDEKITAVPFGFGDVTLATFCGLVVGIANVPLLITLMVLLGGLTALVAVIGQIFLRRTVKAQTVIPYGPAIILSALALLIWDEQVAAMIF